jgi:arylsulfatase A-like enzyme
MLAAAAFVGLALIPAGALPAAVDAPQSTTTAQVVRRPNILFILIDDMGYADLSVMGNRKIQTPNIDRLAAEGVLMTQFYDAAPICSPSRAGFFTGRFPAEVGFFSFINDRAGNARVGQVNWLDPNEPNIARTLHDAGYATGHFGKWHMGGGRDVGDAPHLTAYGFDEAFTSFEGLGPRVLVSDEERFLADQSAKLGQGPVFYELKTNLTQLYAQKVLEFAGKHKDKPWFAQLWLNDVHDPYAPDDLSLAAVRGKGESIDDDRYQATIAKMDRTIGNLIARLRDNGQLENTVIVVTSDNGPGARQMYYKGNATAPGSAGVFRGRKGSLYEGGVRQPLIISWPGHVKAGYRDDVTVGQGVDLLPTLATIAGAPVPAGRNGIDLSPVLSGKSVSQRPAMYWAFGRPGAEQQPGGPYLAHDKAPPLAVRDGKWKLMANADASVVELYDVVADPSETRNVAAKESKTRDRLLQQLQAWQKTIAK